ncbi:16S rRNA methyltransferase, partial [Luteimonas sp. 8-5]|nr:16S rRNA methyltransferase [Luteimonas sp. 8-5]
MSTRTDPALETLLLPFAGGGLAWPREGGALFIGGRDGWPLHAQPLPGLRIEPDDSDSATRYPLVLLLPPRQRDQARAQFARALARLAPGGVLVACMPNKEGAKSGEADLARLAGPLNVLTKNHCRVFWTAPLEA